MRVDPGPFLDGKIKDIDEMKRVGEIRRIH